MKEMRKYIQLLTSHPEKTFDTQRVTVFHSDPDQNMPRNEKVIVVDDVKNSDVGVRIQSTLQICPNTLINTTLCTNARKIAISNIDNSKKMRSFV